MSRHVVPIALLLPQLAMSFGLAAQAVRPAAVSMVKPPLAARTPELRRAQQPAVEMSLIKRAILPADADVTLRNALGYPIFALGIGAFFFPTLLMTELFDATPRIADASLTLMRGLGLTNILLGAKICRGPEKAAPLSAFVSYAWWARLLRNAIRVDILGNFATAFFYFNCVMAVVAARRQGGLYKTMTDLDMGSLSYHLPKKKSPFVTKVVGWGMLAWGIVATFFRRFMFSFNLLGLGGYATRTTALTAFVASGVGLSSFLLAGRVFNDSQRGDVAATGFLYYGGWTILTYLAASNGVFAGRYLWTIMTFGVIMTLRCFTDIFDFPTDDLLAEEYLKKFKDDKKKDDKKKDEKKEKVKA